MKPNLDRREFLFKCCAAGLAGCGFLLSSKASTLDRFAKYTKGDEIDPKKLMYCGYSCPSDCQFLKASLENDTELKREAYELWKIKERFDIDFDPEKIFCFGCKAEDKSEGVVQLNCTVRKCVIEKELDCCIECLELVDCNKDLWSRFPEFKKQVIELQKKYFEEKQ